MALKATLSTELFLNHHKRAQAVGNLQNRQQRNALARQQAAFDYPAQAVGTTPDRNLTLYYDPSLGPQGLALAQQVLDTAGAVYSQCAQYFGIQGQPVNVIIAALNGVIDGSGGAYHNACNFTSGGDIYCDAAFGNPLLTSGLIVAELTECFMGLQNKGWDCGGSNGEALSRFLSEQTTNGPDGVLAGYATASQWDQAGRPDWIDATEPTDQDVVSIGCGMVYLYWMLSQGYTAAQITQAGCPDGTLSSNYSALTGRQTALQDFSAAVAKLKGPIASDNPWPGVPASPPAQPAQANNQIVIDTSARTVAVPAGWEVQ